jgi:hypothetical protein
VAEGQCEAPRAMNGPSQSCRLGGLRFKDSSKIVLSTENQTRVGSRVYRYRFLETITQNHGISAQLAECWLSRMRFLSRLATGYSPPSGA